LSKRSKRRCASADRRDDSGWRTGIAACAKFNHTVGQHIPSFTLGLRAPATFASALIFAAASMLGALDGAQAKYEQAHVSPVAPAQLPELAPQAPQTRVVNLQNLLQPKKPDTQPAFPSELRFGVLGSMEFKVSSHKFSKDWQSVRERVEDERALYEFCTDATSKLCPKKIGEWRTKLSSLKGQDKLEQLKQLNRFVNHLVAYSDDKKAFGKADHWSNPAELLQTSGDCEDYAILKFFSLLELGFSNEQLRLAVVRDSKRRVLHAVVSVDLDGKTYILDSLFDRPVSHQHILKYIPLYSWNLQDHWAHIVTKKIRLKFVESFDKLA
jgi:predicted transglutaminase-like cysteine proteinase